jgi:ribosome biogenesis GTPase A
MAINWFPGHMNKAKREIGKAIGGCRLVIEVLDARIPFSSENPLVAGLRGDTPHIKVLNKRDLADPQITAEWLACFNAKPGVTAVALHREETAKAKAIIALGLSLLPPDRNKIKPITAMVLGIPNSGKSTLINTLVGKNIAKASNRPAVTQRQARIKVRKDFWLLDTPGFLWPKLYPPDCGYRLAVTGAIKDAVVDIVEVAFFAARFVIDTSPQSLIKRYGLDVVPQEEFALMDAIARRRGCLGKGGVVNLQKVSELFIRELRAGALGPISLERPKQHVA